MVVFYYFYTVKIIGSMSSKLQRNYKMIFRIEKVPRMKHSSIRKGRGIKYYLV